jgi:hypothetical protein
VLVHRLLGRADRGRGVGLGGEGLEQRAQASIRRGGEAVLGGEGLQPRLRFP